MAEDSGASGSIRGFMVAIEFKELGEEGQDESERYLDTVSVCGAPGGAGRGWTHQIEQ